MKKLSDYLTPEYILRPSQIIRRIKLKLDGKIVNEYEKIILPWNLYIRLKPYDFIGIYVWFFGVYDLCVSEAIWRLIDPGECAVDVGANIGYMTSIMAVKVSPQGKVICFEPHPELYEELRINVNNWNQNNIGKIAVHQLAISDISGEGILGIPDSFKTNRGLASLVSDNESKTSKNQLFKVQMKRLDEILDPKQEIGLLKIDVEGNEIKVVNGAGELIINGNIRDIIFEDFGEYPTSVTNFLEAHGYTLFYLQRNFWGLVVDDIKRKKYKDNQQMPEGPSYLATKDPGRAIRRLRKKGWGILGFGPLTL